MPEHEKLYALLAEAYGSLKRPKASTRFAYAHPRKPQAPPYLVIGKSAEVIRAAKPKVAIENGAGRDTHRLSGLITGKIRRHPEKKLVVFLVEDPADEEKLREYFPKIPARLMKVAKRAGEHKARVKQLASVFKSRAVVATAATFEERISAGPGEIVVEEGDELEEDFPPLSDEDLEAIFGEQSEEVVEVSRQGVELLGKVGPVDTVSSLLTALQDPGDLGVLADRIAAAALAGGASVDGVPPQLGGRPDAQTLALACFDALETFTTNLALLDSFRKQQKELRREDLKVRELVPEEMKAKVAEEVAEYAELRRRCNRLLEANERILALVREQVKGGTRGS